MIRVGLLYLLPFILIFILFAKQGVKYHQKSGLRTIVALLLFFGFQFISSLLASFLILKYSSAENPKQALLDNILLMNVSSSVLGTTATFLYYRFIENKMKVMLTKENDEINSLGEK